MELMSDPGGTAPGEMRISDRERDEMVAVLREHCAEGRLTLDEFSDRVGWTFEATTTGELERVTAGLPVPAAAPARARKRPRHWVVGFFNSDKLRGRWRPAAHVRAVAVMGNCLVDLRNAELDGDEVTITAWVFMGNVKVLVPEGIEVELTGAAVMGNRTLSASDARPLPGSPIVRVRARVFMGNVKVRDLPTGQPDRDDLSEAWVGELRAGPPPEPSDREAVAQLSEAAAPDGTVTILFSDIEGFTPILERLGDERAYELLRRHNEIIRAQVQACGGYEVKTAGDGFMVAFSSARRALRCAVDIQRDLEARATANPDEIPLKVRIGLHTGEAINDAEDFFGRTVNLASRITNEAGGGHILASSLVRQLAGAVDGISFDGGRPIDLRGINGDQVVHEVSWQVPAGGSEPAPA
jgi:class 3 adenylate cyclase